VGESDPGQLSSDGKWCWDGTKWLSTASADGKFKWDGASWIPNRPAPMVAARSPWTKGLLIGGGGFGALLVGAVVIASIASAFGSPRSSNTLPPVAAASLSPAPSATSQPSQSPSAMQTASPSPSIHPSPSPKPTPKPTPKPLVKPKPSTCGAPANPWGFNFCGGSKIYSPPSGFCGYFPCISSFGNSPGYVIECKDGKYSTAGGQSGACSTHGGVLRALLKR